MMNSTQAASSKDVASRPLGRRRPGTRLLTALALLALGGFGGRSLAEELGELVVKSKPTGATISVDGKPAGKAPLTQSGMTVGRHQIDATWADGSKASGRGKVVAGGSVTVWMKVPVIGAPAEVAAPVDASATAAAVPGNAADAPRADQQGPTGNEAFAAPAAMGTESAPSNMDAPPAPPASRLTILPRPIASPLHPRLRMTPAMTLGLGVYCPNFGGSSRSQPWGRWCAAQVHVGWDGRFGDFHIVGLLGEVLRGGVKVGFELGTRYFQLGTRRSRAALAVRGNFDLLVAKLGEAIPGRADDGLLAFSNTYGPHLSIALNPRASFEIRAAVGWTVGGFFANHDGFDRPTYGLVCEGWMGMRFAP